jgi:uncharacterized protein YndB with AHSA1/START domain
MSDSPAPEPIAAREVFTSRVLHAPVQAVFGAFRDPLQLAQWWGPQGFRNTFEVFEFRVGGTWRFVMHGPDGTDYANESVFKEIVEPQRIVFDHVCAPLFEMTITLSTQANGTLVTWRMLFDKVADREMLRKYAPQGNEQNLDRLGALLAHPPLP